MKLNNISDKKHVDKRVVETKVVDVVQLDGDEHTGPIPGMTPDDPDYEMMRKRLSKLKKTNPSLYKRMINWD